MIEPAGWMIDMCIIIIIIIVSNVQHDKINVIIFSIWLLYAICNLFAINFNLF